MQKIYIILSLSLFALVVYFAEAPIKTKHLSVLSAPTEHNILLDLSSRSDKIIYDNLVYSNYNCQMLNPKQAQCSQFSASAEIISSNAVTELYEYKSNNGRAFKILQLENGAAHIEFKLKSSDTLYRYSFSSLEKIPLFTREKGLFTTGSVEWDISSLDYIL